MTNKKGFTLIELLVVIAIIGLLSTLAVVSLNNARGKARDARRVSDVKAVQTAMELYKADNNDVFGDDLVGAANWTALGTELVNYLAAGVPTDPVATNAYVVCFDGSKTNFIIGATLENNPPAPGVATALWAEAVGATCIDSLGTEDVTPPTCNITTGFCAGSATPVAA